MVLCTYPGPMLSTMPHPAEKCICASVCSSGRLDGLHEASRRALRTVRMPTRQTEDFRFTDLGLITSSQLQVATGGGLQSTSCCFDMLQQPVVGVPTPCLLAVGRQWADLCRPVGGSCPGAGIVRRRWQHPGRQLHTQCWFRQTNHASAGLCQARRTIASLRVAGGCA